MTIHIKPMWDVVDGAYKVDTATYRGLGRVAADNREMFEEALREILPPGENIAISYDDLPKIIPPAERLDHAAGPV
jgi:hypothetical protein